MELQDKYYPTTSLTKSSASHNKDSTMTEQEEKLAFAKAMIATGMLNPLQAGQLVHPCNLNRAAEIASKWHSDKEVLTLIECLKKEEKAKSPISEDEKYVERELKLIIEKSQYEDYKIKALDKLMELKGLSKKPQTGVSVNITQPRAIEVPTYKNDGDWEKAALKQQQELLRVSRSKN